MFPCNFNVHTVLHFTLAQEGCSGFIGSDDAETAAIPSRAQMFYLNTANPAPCTGNITSWTVCYYGPDVANHVGKYLATYALYRRMGSGSSAHYVRVSETFRAQRAGEIYADGSVAGIDGEIAQGGFNYYTDTLDVGASPLTVEAGYILGACVHVFDPTGDFEIGGSYILVTLPLDVVGEASGGSLLQMGTTECTRFLIPSDVPTNQLSFLNSRRLHIYANIGK